MNPGERIERHAAIAEQLAALGDDAMTAWLGACEPLRQDGFASLTIPGGDAPVFVKLLSLTALEREPQHWSSTANCFDLPPYYGYRIGGAGFGARRELTMHELANDWVTSGERAQFPLMHDHRVLPIARPAYHTPVWPNPWGDDPAVAARHAAIEQSTHSVAVFLEPFPHNLLQWLRDRPAGSPGSEDDVLRLEPQLLALTGFINERGLQHMDAHFENILTDGEELFLTDFGLAISDAFELSDRENAFYERHRCFDAVTAMTSLVHAIFTRHAGSKGWRDALRAFLEDAETQLPAMPDADRDFLIRRGELWLAMAGVYRSLRDDITSDFPAEEIERLLEAGAPS